MGCSRKRFWAILTNKETTKWSKETCSATLWELLAVFHCKGTMKAKMFEHLHQKQ